MVSARGFTIRGHSRTMRDRVLGPPKFADVLPTLAAHARALIPRKLPGFSGDPFEVAFDPMLFLQELLLSAEAKQFEEQEHGGLRALERVSLTILEEIQKARLA